MEDIELTLVAKNKDAIKGIKETQKEILVLNDTVKELEKQQKELFEIGKKGFSDVKKIEDYTKKMESLTQEIDKNKKALTDLNKVEEKTEEQHEDLTTSLKTLATSIGGAAAILAVLKKAFLETTQGIKIFKEVAAAVNQVLSDIVNSTGISVQRMAEAARLAGVMEDIRKQQLVDTFKGSQLMAEYNKKLTESNDKMKTNEQRILSLTQAKWLYNKAIDIEIKGTEKLLEGINEGLRLDRTNDALLTQFAEVNTKLKQLESEREAGLRRIVGLESSLREEDFNKQKQIYDKTVDMIRKAADEQIQINEEIKRENERLDAEFAEGKKAFDKKMRDERSRQGELEMQRLEKEYKDKKKLEEDKVKNQIDIEKKYYEWFWEQSEKMNDKAKDDAEKEQDLRDAKIDAWKDVIASANEFTLTLYDRQFDKLENQFNKEAEIEEKKFNASIKAAGKNEKEKARLTEDYNLRRERAEENYNKKKNEINRKAAIADKLAALFNIGINTAVGITKAFPNVFLQVLVAAAGALQAATVAAKPIPQFAKGGWTGNGFDRDSSGERMAGVVHEREFVVRRGPAHKFRDVLEAINRDDRRAILNSFNKVIPEVANTILVENNGPNKRLDEVNTNLRFIRNKEEITVIGNTTIYKKGNTIRTIKK